MPFHQFLLRDRHRGGAIDVFKPVREQAETVARKLGASGDRRLTSFLERVSPTDLKRLAGSSPARARSFLRGLYPASEPSRMTGYQPPSSVAQTIVQNQHRAYRNVGRSHRSVGPHQRRVKRLSARK